MASTGIIFRRDTKANLLLNPPVQGEIVFAVDTNEFGTLLEGSVIWNDLFYALSTEEFLDDENVLVNKTWSSSKIDSELSLKIEEDDSRTLTNKTLTDYSNKINATALHIRAKALTTMTKGTAIRYGGYNSGEDAIEILPADSSSNQVAIGVLTQNLDIGEFGTFISTGILEGINTSIYGIGTILYTDGNGSFSPTQPTLGTIQPLAFVLRSHTINGAIMVNASYPNQIASDVRFTEYQNLTASTVQNAIQQLFDQKQTKLITGTNIKTVNGEDILGYGNIEITSGVSSVNGQTGDVTIDTNILPNYSSEAGKFLSNDGNLVFWNTVRHFDGVTTTEFIATENQTDFFLNYDVGSIEVFKNGILLASDEFTATTGTSIILVIGASLNDVITVKEFGFIETTNIYTKTESDNRFARLASTNLFSAPQIHQVTSTTQLAVDLSHGNNYTLTPYGSGVLSFVNIIPGLSGNIILKNNNNYAITFDSSVKADDTLSDRLSESGEYLISFTCDGGYVYITSASNVTGGGGTAPASTFDTGDCVYVSGSTSTSSTAASQVIFTFDSTLYRTIEISLQLVEGTNVHGTTLLIIHDGTNAISSEYAAIYTNYTLATFNTDISNGLLRILATPITNNTITYKHGTKLIKV